jgi:hypothetical protein
MATGDTPRFPWTGIDPTDWMRTWQSMWRAGAPESLAQTILPGWQLNINSNNSTAPQTEVEVVAKHSYGRQLGRISDALEVLLEERDGPEDKRLSDFLTMKQEIDQVKQDAAATRIQQIVKDLELLKGQDEAQYARLRDALREALK